MVWVIVKKLAFSFSANTSSFTDKPSQAKTTLKTNQLFTLLIPVQMSSVLVVKLYQEQTKIVKQRRIDCNSILNCFQPWILWIASVNDSNFILISLKHFSRAKILLSINEICEWRPILGHGNCNLSSLWPLGIQDIRKHKSI